LQPKPAVCRNFRSKNAQLEFAERLLMGWKLYFPNTVGPIDFATKACSLQCSNIKKLACQLHGFLAFNCRLFADGVVTNLKHVTYDASLLRVQKFQE